MSFKTKFFILVLPISCFLNQAQAGTCPQKNNETVDNNSQLSIAIAVNKTLREHPNILRNAANRMAANSAIQQAKSGFMPRIDTQFGVGRSSTSLGYPVATYDQNNVLNLATSSVSITQPIFSGLSTYNLLRQRKEEFKAANYTENVSKEDLALQAVYAYINVLLTRHLHNLFMHNINVHKEILNKVDIKYKGGGGTKADVDLATGRLAQKMARLREVEGSEANSVADFLEVVGMVPQNIFLPKEAPALPSTLSVTLDMALKNNPARCAAEANFNAADRAVAVSKSVLLPEINLQFSKTDNKNDGGTNLHTRDTRGVLVARYNIFNGGGDINNIDRVKYYRQAALYNLRDTKNKIIEKTTKMWHKLRADRLSLEENYKHLHAVEKTLAAYKEQFYLGRNTLLNVLDMEDEVFNAKVRVANGQYILIIDRYELLANMGILAAYFNKDK